MPLQDHAARAALLAVELAASKYSKRDDERRQHAQKRKGEVPAKRRPAEYRCVKVSKEPKTAEAVAFTCTVSGSPCQGERLRTEAAVLCIPPCLR